jgi:hypothetical protein
MTTTWGFHLEIASRQEVPTELPNIMRTDWRVRLATSRERRKSRQDNSRSFIKDATSRGPPAIRSFHGSIMSYSGRWRSWEHLCQPMVPEPKWSSNGSVETQRSINGVSRSNKAADDEARQTRDKKRGACQTTTPSWPSLHLNSDDDKAASIASLSFFKIRFFVCLCGFRFGWNIGLPKRDLCLC